MLQEISRAWTLKLGLLPDVTCIIWILEMTYDTQGLSDVT